MKPIGTTCPTCEGHAFLDHGVTPPLPVRVGSGSFHVLPCERCQGIGLILTPDELAFVRSLAKALRLAR